MHYLFCDKNLNWFFVARSERQSTSDRADNRYAIVHPKQYLKGGKGGKVRELGVMDDEQWPCSQPLSSVSLPGS